MTLFDNIFNNSQDPEQQQAALQLESQVNNSVIPSSVTEQFNAPVTAQDLPQQTMQVIPQEAAGVPAGSTSTSTAQEEPSVLSKLAGLFTDPAFLQSAAAFGSSMSGDLNGFQQNMNAYASTMATRRQEAAAKIAAAAKRQQDLQDQALQNTWKDQAAMRDALLKNYTVDSVREYMSTGDTSKLIQIPLTLEQQRQQSNTEVDQGIKQASLNETVNNNAANRLNDAKKLSLEQEKNAASIEKDQAKLTEAKSAKWDAANNLVNSAQEGFTLVDSIIKDKALNSYFGPFDRFTPNITPSSQRVEGNIMQMGSQQFLDNVQAMKGLGALSNAEGLKIQSARSNLFTYDRDGNPSIRQGLSEADVKKQLTQIRKSYGIMMKEAQSKRDALTAPAGSTVRDTTTSSPQQETTSQQAASTKVNYSDKYKF